MKSAKLKRVQIIASLGTLAFRGLIHSLCSLRFVVGDRAAIPGPTKNPNLYVFWHESLLVPAYTHAKTVVSLISRSRDGDIAAAIVKKLGGRSVRGSSTRGGPEALRELVRLARTHHLGIAIDGPQGPPRKASPGAVRLASITGMPIVPVGCGLSRFLRIGPRDMKLKFPVPLLCRAWVVAGTPMRVPGRLSRPEIISFTERLQEAMDLTQARADKLASGDEPPPSALTLRKLYALQKASASS